MVLTVRSLLHYSEGKPSNKNASHIYIYVSPSKLRGPYNLKQDTMIFGQIVSAEPVTEEEENFQNTMYDAVSGVPVSMLLQPAYELKDYLFLSRSSNNKLNKVGIVPEQFVLTVEISHIDAAFVKRKVYPKAHITDDEVSA